MRTMMVTILCNQNDYTLAHNTRLLKRPHNRLLRDSSATRELTRMRSSGDHGGVIQGRI